VILLKDKFLEYYHNPNLEKLFRECLFVFDSCSILELYQSKKKVAIEAFQVLEDPKVIDRIWIPHQVALEYQRNRLKRIHKYENENDIKTALGNINVRINDVDASLDAFKKILNNLSLIQESNIDLDDSLEMVTTSKNDLEKIKNRFIEIKEGYKPNYLFNDEIRDKIDKLFENNIGDPFTYEELIEIYKEGEDRYKNEIPPGYKDAKTKKNNREYGDLVIWKQIINRAKSKDNGTTDIIFITDDEKEDWWFLQPNTKNKRLGPQAELVKEFVSETGREFHMFTLKEFLPKINDILNLGQDSETLKHVGLTETSSIYHELRDASKIVSVLSNAHVFSDIAGAAVRANIAEQAAELERTVSALSNSHALSNIGEIAVRTSIAEQAAELDRTVSALSNSHALSNIGEITVRANIADQTALEAAKAASVLSSSHIFIKEDDEDNEEENDEEENND